MYWQPPKVAEGFDLADYLPDDCQVWPCHREACLFFEEFCHTQWRVATGGITGLDYTAILACLRSLGIKRERQQELFAQVRAIESGVLQIRCEQANDG